MGRRKIEIKAIKDDRNRSVTFLKRKGGLFKKAHELSVLCSVDVAVFVFGNNKKLYEYSSADMRDLIARYQFHGGPNEHKGPADFNGGNDDDDDEEGDGSPPQGHEHMDHPMMAQGFHGQQPQFPPQIARHHTPSASPPIPNGAVFPGHAHQRSHTPQGVASRPVSRNDGRGRMSNMAPQGPHPGITYMPTPPIYNPQNQQGMLPHGMQVPYSYQQTHGQQPQQQMEERRPSAPPTYTSAPPAYTSGPSAQPTVTRAGTSPPQPAQQNIPQISTTPPQPEIREPQPSAPTEVKSEPREQVRPQPPQPPLLNTDTAIKKLPQRKGHSIFTPIEENRSILSQHLASFSSEPQNKDGPAGRPPMNPNRRTSSPKNQEKGRGSISSIPETTFTPPSRTNSGTTGSARPRGPRLTVQIPDGGSETGSVGDKSVSPQVNTDTSNEFAGAQRQNSHSSIVLPPPSPSASALLSAGASGPPNPFAKPPPQQNVAETPASALPSRFLGNEFLPSPSSFYNDWNFRASDNNTLPSPLNFATPVGPSGPSFLREDNSTTAGTTAAGSSLTATAGGPKRKSPDSENERGDGQDLAGETKRLRVE